MDLGSKARKGGKKNRKFGRGMRRPSKTRYNGEKRWLRNRASKLLRHIKRFPRDRVAQQAFSNMKV